MLCERCNSVSNTLRMSFFNTDMCCPSCLEREQQHPDYEKAKQVELEEVKKGNYNFLGIGLPKELQ